MMLERRPPRRSASPEHAADKDFRCCCGSLLARVTPDGVQLKCRRCKRTLLVPITGESTAGRARPES